MWKNIKQAFNGSRATRKASRHSRCRRSNIERLEDRHLLAAVVPQQGNNVNFTSGPTDWVFLRANTLTNSPVNSASNSPIAADSPGESCGECGFSVSRKRRTGGVP